MKINRFLPLLIPLLSFGFLQFFFFWPRMIYVILVLALILFLFTTRQFIKASLVKDKWWDLMILPSLFLISIAFFCTMLTNKIVIQLLFFVNLIFLYLYFTAVYNQLFKKEQGKSYTIPNLASYGNFLAFYFISSSLFGLQIFLNFPVWILMIILLLVTGLIVRQVFWANKINQQIGLFYLLIITIVLIEVAWTLSFWPLSYYILGLVMSIFYYIIIGIIRFYLLHKLDGKIIKLYLIYGFLGVIVVLLTARWL